jgi:alpha-1,3-fucosyltransferase
LHGKHAYEDARSAFDAVLIHAPEFDFRYIPDISKWRRPNQRFVYVNMESPQSYNTPDVRAMNNFFNWTMTYRYDSDIPRPYGFFQPLSTKTKSQRYFPVQFTPQDFLPYNEHDFVANVLPTLGEELHKLANRPKKVAWIVSRCYSPSRREDYVSKLKEYIDIDILGGCGDIPCDSSFAQHAYKDNCTAAVEEEYKFYLSFENSYCRDYVTEKLYRRLKGNALPVVLGAGNYTTLLPEHSYLNALDFEPQALAERLMELDNNNSMYLSYFWWKQKYEVHNGTATDHASSMCRLCEMLHDQTLPATSYSSMSAWHGEKAQCWRFLPRVVQSLLPKFGSSPDDDDDGEPFDGLDDHF